MTEVIFFDRARAVPKAPRLRGREEKTTDIMARSPLLEPAAPVAVAKSEGKLCTKLKRRGGTQRFFEGEGSEGLGEEGEFDLDWVSSPKEVPLTASVAVLKSSEEKNLLEKEKPLVARYLETKERLAKSKTPAETTELEKEMNGTVNAILEIYRPYVVRMAMNIRIRWCVSFLSIDDLVQEGLMGVTTALRKYDKGKNTSLKTYSTLWIFQNITRHILNTERAIRIPVWIYDQASKIQKQIQRHLAEYGKGPNAAEISRGTGLKRKAIELRLEAMKLRTYSLQALVSDSTDDEGDFGDLRIMADQNAPNPLEQLGSRDAVEALRAVMPPAHWRVIYGKVGLGENGEETGLQIGVDVKQIQDGIAAKRKKSAIIVRSAFAKSAKLAREEIARGEVSGREKLLVEAVIEKLEGMRFKTAATHLRRELIDSIALEIKKDLATKMKHAPYTPEITDAIFAFMRARPRYDELVLVRFEEMLMHRFFEYRGKNLAKDCGLLLALALADLQKSGMSINGMQTERVLKDVLADRKRRLANGVSKQRVSQLYYEALKIGKEQVEKNPQLLEGLNVLESRARRRKTG